MTERHLDAFLRAFSILTVCAGLLTLWIVAPLFAPRPSMSEAVLLERCLAQKGFPLLDSWTGQLVGCQK